jgi:hypothetical protein
VLWLRDWEFCRKHDCRDEAISNVRDRFFVLQWLWQSKNDFFKMHAMRRLLSENASSARNLYQTSDEEVIDRIADLLISGRLHVHPSPARASPGGTSQGSTAGSSGQADALVPFPITERKPGAPVAASSEPVVDPCCCVLKIKELTFSGAGFHKVENDTLGDFPTPEWLDGRADQSPVSYARNTKLTISTKFAVTTAACRGGESVQLRGKVTFGSVSMELTGSTTVNPGDTEVPGTLTSDKAFPDEVGIFESSDITWETNRCDCGWTSAGTSRNVVYVTLSPPAGGVTNYWTLLDVSCRAAAGAKTENALVHKSYVPFKAATGDGNGIKRKRDGKELTYWFFGRKSPAVFDTHALLAETSCSGRCGSWASLLVDMHKVHGVTSSAVFGVVPTANVRGLLPGCNFMVQVGTFSGAGSKPVPFTHEAPAEYVKGTGLAGLGKTNPQPVFPDHALVKYGGKVYDPSYGGGPVADLLTWERAGIAGLCAGPNVIVMQDGQELRLMQFNSKGFAIYTAVAGDTLASIATQFGVASAAALYNHPYNATFRATHPAQTIAAGESILIPRDISNVAILEIR